MASTPTPKMKAMASKKPSGLVAIKAAEKVAAAKKAAAGKMTKREKDARSAASSKVMKKKGK